MLSNEQYVNAQEMVGGIKNDNGMGDRGNAAGAAFVGQKAGGVDLNYENAGRAQ